LYGCAAAAWAAWQACDDSCDEPSAQLLDAGYGNDSKLRAGITELGLTYVAGIQPQTLVWKPGVRPGRVPKKGRRDAPNATSVKDLALSLRARSWRTIKWREGTSKCGFLSQ
jgi:SRSO17 transposase